MEIKTRQVPGGEADTLFNANALETRRCLGNETGTAEHVCLRCRSGNAGTHKHKWAALLAAGREGKKGIERLDSEADPEDHPYLHCGDENP